jgi:phage shock protein E
VRGCIFLQCREKWLVEAKAIRAMKWKFILPAAVAALIAFNLRADSTLSTGEARQKLKAGALLVDVRTPEEFAASKLTGAVNVPVDTIKSGITNHVTDKSQAVLLHCRSGRRSAVAEKELRSLGYTNVFNLGSFEQARKVVETKDR